MSRLTQNNDKIEYEQPYVYILYDRDNIKSTNNRLKDTKRIIKEKGYLEADSIKEAKIVVILLSNNVFNFQNENYSPDNNMRGYVSDLDDENCDDYYQSYDNKQYYIYHVPKSDIPNIYEVDYNKCRGIQNTSLPNITIPIINKYSVW